MRGHFCSVWKARSDFDISFTLIKNISALIRNRPFSSNPHKNINIGQTSFQWRDFVLMPFYFVLETLPNLRHAVTIFALGMRFRSKNRKTFAAFETVLNGWIYQIEKNKNWIASHVSSKTASYMHKLGKRIVFEDTFYSFFHSIRSTYCS